MKKFIRPEIDEEISTIHKYECSLRDDTLLEPSLGEKAAIYEFANLIGDESDLKMMPQCWEHIDGLYALMFAGAWRKDIIFQSMPDEARTEDMCCVLMNRGFEFSLIPERLQTKEVCLRALANNVHVTLDNLSPFKLFENSSVALSYLSDKDFWEELCKRNGFCLKWVPKSFKTKELCEIACTFKTKRELHEETDDRAFYDDDGIYQREFYDHEYYEDEDDDEDNLLRTELIKKAVPKKWRTKEMCDKAFSETKQAIVLYPTRFMTEELCIKAVDLQPELFSQLPLEKRTVPVAYATAATALFYSDEDHSVDIIRAMPFKEVKRVLKDILRHVRKDEYIFVVDYVLGSFESNPDEAYRLYRLKNWMVFDALDRLARKSKNYKLITYRNDDD